MSNQVEAVAKAIFNNDKATLRDILKDGFNINRSYASPIGIFEKMYEKN
jgi:hypothetical protein